MRGGCFEGLSENTRDLVTNIHPRALVDRNKLFRIVYLNPTSALPLSSFTSLLRACYTLPCTPSVTCGYVAAIISNKPGLRCCRMCGSSASPTKMVDTPASMALVSDWATNSNGKLLARRR